MARIFRIYTAGEADAGKSTLVGRLLHDSGGLTRDQIAQISAGGAPSFHLVTDGLADEQTGNMTIDTAYRHFSSGGHRFLIADTPGQHDLVQNSVTGGSTADLLLLAAAADRPVSAELIRHLYVGAWLGIKRIILCVTKIDAVSDPEKAFCRILDSVAEKGAEFGVSLTAAVPVSSLDGSNLVLRSAAHPWYGGATVNEALIEAAAAEDSEPILPLRLQIQTTFSAGGTHFAAGIVVEGRIVEGQLLRSAAGEFRVADLLCSGRKRAYAAAGAAVAFLAQDFVGRGTLAYPPDSPPLRSADALLSLCWFGPESLNPGSSIVIRQGTALIDTSIGAIESVIDEITFKSGPGVIEPGGFGEVRILSQGKLAFDPPATENRSPRINRVVLFDPNSGKTVAAGKIIADNRGSPDFRR